MDFLLSTMVWGFPLIAVLIATHTGTQKKQTIQNIICALAFLWASFFAAIRFQVGDDWQGYELYYAAIDTSMGIVESYISDPHMLQFEPGYFIVSYLAKQLGAPYSVINMISVSITALALLIFAKRISAPLYLPTVIFLGIPLISLYYNQVRQCFAIGFLLLAISSKRTRFFTVFAIAALLFQFSSAIIVLLNLLTRKSESLSVATFRFALALLPIAILVLAIGLFNPYALLKFVLPQALAFKIDIYEQEETALGLLRIASAAFITFTSIHLYKLLRCQLDLSKIERQIVTTSLLTALLVPYALITFPNSYSFFGRALVFALIFLSFSGAIMQKHKLISAQNTIKLKPVYGLALLSVVYYGFSLVNYSEVLLPYRSIWF
jgi:EpsG family